MTTDDLSRSSPDVGIIRGTTAVFSMKQAAEVAGISVSTLRRRRSDLIAAGAVISPDGWKVPITALVACGLIAGEGPEAAFRPVSVTPRSGDAHTASGQSRQIEELTVQVRKLEHEVGEWRRRAEVAEVRAEERGRALDALRIANETERMALRMLTTGTTVAPTQVQESAPATQSTPSPSGAAPKTVHPSRPIPAAGEPRRKGFFSRVMGI